MTTTGSEDPTLVGTVRTLLLMYNALTGVFRNKEFTMNKLVAGLIILVLAGCDQGGGRTAINILDGSAGRTKMTVSDPAEMNYSDSSFFDRELSGTMEAKPREIRVAVQFGFRVDGRVPQRIDKWLYTIQDSGGKVSAVQDPPPPKTRGLITMLISVAVQIWDAFAETRMYSPAKNYNATLLYDEEKVVTEIVFNHR